MMTIPYKRNRRGLQASPVVFNKGSIVGYTLTENNASEANLTRFSVRHGLLQIKKEQKFSALMIWRNFSVTYNRSVTRHPVRGFGDPGNGLPVLF